MPAEPCVYSTRTCLGDLLADPAAAAVLQRHFPDLATNPRLAGAHKMSLRAISIFAPELLPQAALSAVDDEFEALNP